MSTSGPTTTRSSSVVDGLRLAWTRSGPRGAGPPVVLAHGLTDDASCWGRTALRLAERHDVLAYDARGHGASDRARDYSTEAHTRDLVGLVRALELDAPVVVGHSMGGVHAVLAATEIDISGLVLEDPAWTVAADGSKDVGASERRFVATAELPEAERRESGRSRHPSWDSDDLECWVQAQPRVDHRAVSWFHSWPTTNRWRDHVSRLTCPGLLVIGTSSAVAPATAVQVRGLWPEVQVAQVPGAGHDVRRDHFDAFWSVVAPFVASLR